MEFLFHFALMDHFLFVYLLGLLLACFGSPVFGFKRRSAWMSREVEVVGGGKCDQNILYKN